MGAKKARQRAPVKYVKEQMSDEGEEEEEDYMSLNNTKKKTQDSDDDEVFKLDIDESDEESDEQKNDDDDDDDGEDDDDDGEDDDEDDSDEDSENELANLVDSLPPSMRQKVLDEGGEDESSDSDGEGQEETSGWGKKKSTYWSGDTADLEIGQDIADAEEEEEAATEQQQEKLNRMKESDFFDDVEGDEKSKDSSDSDSEEVDEEEKNNLGSRLKRGDKKSAVSAAKKTLKRKAGKDESEQLGMGMLDMISLGAGYDSSGMHMERIAKDISKLSKQQKIQLVKTQSPELAGFVNEMNIRVEELQGTFLVIKDYFGENEAISDLDEGLVDYMGLKEQLLLTYCINVVFYLYMKAMGKVVENHPLMKQLLQVRYLMERMVPLDKQYKEDLEDLVQRAVGREEGEEEEEEEESGDGKGSNDQDAQEGDEEDEENDEEEDKEEVQSCDGEVQGEDENETEERRREEEGEFEQMTLTKRRRLAKKAKKGAAARLNNFEDIGDIEKVEAPRPSRPLGKASKEKSDYDDNGDGDADASDEFMRMLMDAADETPGGKGKRRPAPSGAMDLEDEPNIMEEFIDKKKAFLAHKAGKYVPEPRYGGREAEEVEAGSGKRAASYEIMKNKGLTPHRKKANRNPRVKKKQMYEKSVKARKGQVREVITGKAGSYGGETTGIKNITRSRKIY